MKISIKIKLLANLKLLFIGVGFLNAAFAATHSMPIHVASHWVKLTNQNCGYSISYPKFAKLMPVDENFRQGFHFNPIQFIDDLKNTDLFKNIVINNDCITKISLPIQPKTNLDGKYLILFTVDNVPNQWPPPFMTTNLKKEGELFPIGNKQFYKVVDADAGMCHHFDYNYYFLKKLNRYYVVLFLLASHCPDVAPNQTNFNLKTETKDFNWMLSSFSNL